LFAAVPNEDELGLGERVHDSFHSSQFTLGRFFHESIHKMAFSVVFELSKFVSSSGLIGADLY
jgi:hypothetical protein